MRFWTVFSVVFLLLCQGSLRMMAMVTSEESTSDTVLTLINGYFVLLDNDNVAVAVVDENEQDKAAFERFSSRQDFLDFFFKELDPFHRQELWRGLEDSAIQVRNAHYLVFSVLNGLRSDPFELAKKLIDMDKLVLLDHFIELLNDMRHYVFRGSAFGFREDLLIMAANTGSKQALKHVIEFTVPLIGTPIELDDFYVDDLESGIDYERLWAFWSQDANDANGEERAVTQDELQFTLAYCMTPELVETIVSLGAIITPGMLNNFPTYDLPDTEIRNLKRTYFSLIDLNGLNDLNTVFDDSLFADLVKGEDISEQKYIEKVVAILLDNQAGKIFSLPNSHF